MLDNSGNRVPGDGREHPVHEATVIHVPGDWYGPPLWGYSCSCGERDMRHQSQAFAVERAEEHGARIVSVFEHPPHPDFDDTRQRAAELPFHVGIDWPRTIALALAALGLIGWMVGRVI